MLILIWKYLSSITQFDYAYSTPLQNIGKIIMATFVQKKKNVLTSKYTFIYIHCYIYVKKIYLFNLY